jgi:putative transcriptional regulator
MKIKELRLERGLTKVQLAKELGVNKRTILRWEQDMMCMSLKHALKLADFFEVSIDDLITKEKRGTRKL